MIDLRCPTCANVFQVADMHAGKTCSCQCGTKIKIPDGEAGGEDAEAGQPWVANPMGHSSEDHDGAWRRAGASGGAVATLAVDHPFIKPRDLSRFTKVVESKPFSEEEFRSQLLRNRPPRRASKLGLAAILVGAVALTLCWIPAVGVVASLIALTGFGLGFAGVLFAMTEYKIHIGRPLVGTVMSAVALGAVLVIYSLTDPGLDRATALTAGLSVPELDGLAPPTKKEEPPQTLDAVAYGEVKVAITSIRIGPVKSINTETQITSETSTQFLSIELEITNLSAVRTIDYQTWGAPPAAIGGLGTNKLAEITGTRLTDNFNRSYKRIRFTGTDGPLGRLSHATIEPGKMGRDLLIFEPPSVAAGFLTLYLPASHVGGEGTIPIRIPRSAIQQ